MGKNIQMLIEDVENMYEEIEDNNIDKDDEKTLLYESRLRKLIKDISEYESFKGIQITKEGIDRIEKNSKYIISMMIFEIIEELKVTNRKQIKSCDADKSLDKVLHKVSGIDNAILMLKEDINKLEKIRDNSITNKVDTYINEI